MTLDLDLPPNLILSSISRWRDQWSVVLWRDSISMDNEHIVIRHPDPQTALSQAIDAFTTGIGLTPPIDRRPTCDSLPTSLDALSNLLSIPTITLSPPAFKLKI